MRAHFALLCAACAAAAHARALAGTHHNTFCLYTALLAPCAAAHLAPHARTHLPHCLRYFLFNTARAPPHIWLHCRCARVPPYLSSLHALTHSFSPVCTHTATPHHMEKGKRTVCEQLFVLYSTHSKLPLHILHRPNGCIVISCCGCAQHSYILSLLWVWFVL